MTDALPYGMMAGVTRLRGISGLPKGAEGCIRDVVLVRDKVYWRIIVDTPGKSGYERGQVLGGRQLEWEVLEDEEE